MYYKPTFQVLLDTRRIKKDKTYPIKIRVTYNRNTRYYRTGLSFSKEDYSKIISEHPRGKYKEYRIQIGIIEKKVSDIIKTIKDNFNFNLFSERLGTKPQDAQNIIIALNHYAESLEKEERFKYASSIKNTFITYFSLKRVYKSLTSSNAVENTPIPNLNVIFIVSPPYRCRNST